MTANESPADSNNNEEDELIEMFTFGGSNDDDEPPAEITDETAQAANPLMMLAWRLIRWPLLFVLVNMGVGVAVFNMWMETNREVIVIGGEEQEKAEAPPNLAHFLVLSLLGLVDTLLLLYAIKWLKPQVAHLRGQEPLAEGTEPPVISPHAHLAHSLDQYLSKRMYARRHANSTATTVSKGFVVNSLILLALVALLITGLCGTVYGVGMEVCDSNPSSTRNYGRVVNKSDKKDLPPELQTWNVQDMGQYTKNYLEQQNETLILGRSEDPWFEASGPLYRVSGGDVVLVREIVVALVPRNDGYCWIENNHPSTVTCYSAATSLTEVTTLEVYDRIVSVAKDHHDTIWVSCEVYLKRGYVYHVLKLTGSGSTTLVTLIKSHYTEESNVSLPACLQGKWGSTIMLGTAIACILCGAGLNFKFPSTIGILFVGVDILIEEVSKTGAGFASDIFIFALLGLLILGRELSMLSREKQSWALYTMWAYAALDFATTWNYGVFFWLSFIPGIAIAWLVLDHPVLLFLSAVIAPWAIMSLVFGILYPPLLALGLYGAILAGGMVLVDRQWSKIRPYVIYYIKRWCSCCSRGLERQGGSSSGEVV